MITHFWLTAAATLSMTATQVSATPARVDTIYDAPQGVVTIVTGIEDPPVHRGPPAQMFHDEVGRLVKVYAIRPITLAEARADLLRCRAAEAHVAAMRRRRAWGE